MLHPEFIEESEWVRLCSWLWFCENYYCVIVALNLTFGQINYLKISYYLIFSGLPALYFGTNDACLSRHHCTVNRLRSGSKNRHKTINCPELELNTCGAAPQSFGALTGWTRNIWGSGFYSVLSRKEVWTVWTGTVTHRLYQMIPGSEKWHFVAFTYTLPPPPPLSYSHRLYPFQIEHMNHAGTAWYLLARPQVVFWEYTSTPHLSTPRLMIHGVWSRADGKFRQILSPRKCLKLSNNIDTPIVFFVFFFFSCLRPILGFRFWE